MLVSASEAICILLCSASRTYAYHSMIENNKHAKVLRLEEAATQAYSVFRTWLHATGRMWLAMVSLATTSSLPEPFELELERRCSVRLRGEQVFSKILQQIHDGKERDRV